MKRIAYLLLAAMALMFCSCSVSAPETVPSDTAELSFLKTLKVRVQDSQTKMTVGDLDPDANNYPLNITPYNYETGIGDFFQLIGASGDIADYKDENVTMSPYFVVESVSSNFTTLELDGVAESYREGFEAADYFILINVIHVLGLEQFDDNEIRSGVVLANWFTKEEMLSLLDGSSDQDSVLPLYPLTSLLKLHVTFPQLDNELLLNSVKAHTPGICPRKYIDLSKLPQMIAEKSFYGDSTAPYSPTYIYMSRGVNSGDEMDIYVAIDPGRYDSMRLEFNMEDDVYTYDFTIDSKRGFEIAAGKLYTSSVTISRDQIMEGRELIPVLAVGNQIFPFDDFYEENAQPLSEKLETTSVVFAGYGLESDFDNVDVMGKVAVISRGQITFSDKVINAQNAGAVGVIIYNNQPGMVNMDLSDIYGTDHIPAISTTSDFGEYLSSHPDEKVSLWMSLSDMEKALGN